MTSSELLKLIQQWEQTQWGYMTTNSERNVLWYQIETEIEALYLDRKAMEIAKNNIDSAELDHPLYSWEFWISQ